LTPCNSFPPLLRCRSIPYVQFFTTLSSFNTHSTSRRGISSHIILCQCSDTSTKIIIFLEFRISPSNPDHNMNFVICVPTCNSVSSSTAASNTNVLFKYSVLQSPPSNFTTTTQFSFYTFFISCT